MFWPGNEVPIATVFLRRPAELVFACIKDPTHCRRECQAIVRALRSPDENAMREHIMRYLNDQDSE
eukprot:10424514-Lingulodinium_polyedra.AAC.1